MFCFRRFSFRFLSKVRRNFRKFLYSRWCCCLIDFVDLCVRFSNGMNISQSRRSRQAEQAKNSSFSDRSSKVGPWRHLILFKSGSLFRISSTFPVFIQSRIERILSLLFNLFRSFGARPGSDRTYTRIQHIGVLMYSTLSIGRFWTSRYRFWVNSVMICLLNNHWIKAMNDLIFLSLMYETSFLIKDKKY